MTRPTKLDYARAIVRALSLWLLAAASVVVLSACGTSDDGAPRVFRESDLAEIVRGSGNASGDLTPVDSESGPQTLADVAEAYSVSPALVRKFGFVAAYEAFLDGPDALSYSASALLFADPGGAGCFLRLVRDLFEADADTERIDVRSFGADALGYSIELAFLFESHLYVWRNGNLVLEVVAPTDGARAFAEQLDERANAR